MPQRIASRERPHRDKARSYRRFLRAERELRLGLVGQSDDVRTAR
jgi:hypothetical protein